MKTRLSSCWRCGTLTGLALLLGSPAVADEALRKQVHRDYGHRSYMLVEDATGARLFLFADGIHRSSTAQVTAGADADAISMAIEGTRSEDPRERVRALTRLAGFDNPDALDIALTLLSDPSSAVRDEARSLILDHPGGQALADALGLVDEDVAE